MPWSTLFVSGQRSTAPRALYNKAFEAVPTLDVAVSDVPRPLGPWLRSPADARVTRLLYQPLLSADSDEARAGKAPGQLAAGLESSDLGRRLIFRLRDGIPWSDRSRRSPPLTWPGRSSIAAIPTRPSSRRGGTTCSIEWNRSTTAESKSGSNDPLFKLGAWFAGPVGPAHAGIDGRVATVEQRRQLVSDGPFQFLAESDHSVELIRTWERPRRRRLSGEQGPADPRGPLSSCQGDDRSPGPGRGQHGGSCPRRPGYDPPVHSRHQGRTIHPTPDAHDRARCPRTRS